VGKPQGNIARETDVDVKVILRWIQEILAVNLWDSIQLAQGRVQCRCEHGAEPSGFIKAGNLTTE
jgi:hypothetical protein